MKGHAKRLLPEHKDQTLLQWAEPSSAHFFVQTVTTEDTCKNVAAPFLSLCRFFRHITVPNAQSVEAQTHQPIADLTTILSGMVLA